MRGGGGGGVEVVRYGKVARQGGIDLLPLYRSARQECSLPPPPPPSLSFILSPSKVGLFPDLSDLGEPATQSSPVWACILPQAPRPVFL